jgi:hypothetical protein
MKILFIEINYKGHHISLYAKKLIEKFIKKNQVYFLTSTKAYQSEEFRSIKFFKKKIKIITISIHEDIKNKNNFYIFAYHLWNLFLVYKSAISIIRKEKIDLVYFNYLDPFVFIFSIFFFLNFKVKVFGLLLNIKFHQYYFNLRKKNYLDSIKFFLFKLFLRKKYVNKIFVIDHLFIKYLNVKKIISNKIIKIDEAFNKTKNNNIKKKKYNKKKTILIYGSISIRKNFKLLIDFLIKSKLINKFKVIIAGRFDDDSKRIINNAEYFNIIVRKRLIIKDYFIDFSEEKYLLQKTDLVWLCYEGGSDGSSGVLQLSIDNIKPVIFYDKGLIHDICQTHKLGFKIFYNKNKFNQLYKFFYSKDLDHKIFQVKKNIAKYKKSLKRELIFENRIFKEVEKISYKKI